SGRPTVDAPAWESVFQSLAVARLTGQGVRGGECAEGGGAAARPRLRPHGIAGQALVTVMESVVQARAWSLIVKPRPGRSGTIMRPSRVSRRSLKSGSSQSKCSTHGSRG